MAEHVKRNVENMTHDVASFPLVAYYTKRRACVARNGCLVYHYSRFTLFKKLLWALDE
jgi:hypothetical protein